MAGAVIVALTVVMIGYSIIAKRADRMQISAPMLFLVAGAVIFTLFPGLEVTGEEVHLLAEMTLVVVLFHDASTIRVGRLRHHPGLPARLLLIGFPLALAFTFGVGYWLLPGIGLAGALLLAGMLTPTDAGLGAATILNPIVPERIRRALNVESGLNDGLATPVVLVAIATLAADEGETVPPFVQVSVPPTVLAVVLALVVGIGVAWLVDRSQEHGMSSVRGRAMVVLVLPLLLWGAAELIGANGFLSAFLGGLVFGARSDCLARDGEAAELIETTADLLSFAVWFLAGGLILVALEAEWEWSWLLMALLALTVLRIVPVAISMIGSGLRWPAVLFMGWFGPRGLATIVFALLAIEELGSDHELAPVIAGVSAATVVISVFTHGASSRPLARRFGRWCVANLPEERHPELAPTRVRGRHTYLPSDGPPDDAGAAAVAAAADAAGAGDGAAAADDPGAGGSRASD